MELIVILFWIIISIVIGSIASGKGRSWFGWFLLSLLISPIIAILLLLVVGENKTVIAKQRASSGQYRTCPYCAEEILAAARVCKHCSRDVPVEVTPPKNIGLTDVSEEESIAAITTLRDQYKITNINPKAGIPPLIAMAKSGDIEAVKLLIKAGADIKANHQGFTAADHAKMKGHEEILEILQAMA